MPQLRAVSHLVIATDDVPKMAAFFSSFFGVKAHFENKMFVEFVLPSRFRIAFFKPAGVSAKFFRSPRERVQVGYGVTATHIDKLHERALEPSFQKQGVSVSGPPKSHPWGERSFLLIDPDGNRWEVTESPSPDGMLVDR